MGRRRRPAANVVDGSPFRRFHQQMRLSLAAHLCDTCSAGGMGDRLRRRVEMRRQSIRQRITDNQLRRRRETQRSQRGRGPQRRRNDKRIKTKFRRWSSAVQSNRIVDLGRDDRRPPLCGPPRLCVLCVEMLPRKPPRKVGGSAARRVEMR